MLTDSAAGAPEQIVQGLAVGSGVYAALSALNWLRNSDWSNADAEGEPGFFAKWWKRLKWLIIGVVAQGMFVTFGKAVGMRLLMSSPALKLVGSVLLFFVVRCPLHLPLVPFTTEHDVTLNRAWSPTRRMAAATPRRRRPSCRPRTSRRRISSRSRRSGRSPAPGMASATVSTSATRT